ncbi:MAG TPA: NUDIX hydrolase [Geothermobacteraceae bacterium]|nr:NUDIX hydrolase [Geothermobacteraceae bacterium]
MNPEANPLQGTVMDKPSWYYRQSGVIPFREQDDDLEILLVTTRKRRHWSIPKGIVEPGLTTAQSAIKEAWEEAGVRGFLLPYPLGVYQQQKWGGVCHVEVFLFQVDEEAHPWPEAELRQRQWFSIAAALEAVHNEELRELMREGIRKLADRYRPDGVNPIEELQL